MSAWFREARAGDGGQRPARSLLTALSQVAPTSAGGIDFARTDAGLLQRLGEDASTVHGVVSLGVGAVGRLLAESSVAIEDGSISADSVEALGHLLSELGDLATHCQVLAARCSAKTSEITAF